MKKNLFNFDFKNSSNDAHDLLTSQITCEPCASECERIKRKINNRKLSDIKKEEIANIFSPFNIDN